MRQFFNFKNQILSIILKIEKKAKSLLFGSGIILLIFGYQNCARDFNKASYSSSSSSSSQSNGVNNLSNTIDSDLSEILNNKIALRAIISDTSNSAFNCLTSTSTRCLTGTPRSTSINRIYTTGGTVYIDDLLNINRGLNSAGEQCSTFNFLNQNTGVNDENCPLKIDILWEPICANGTYTCTNDQLVHYFRVSYSKSNSSPSLIIISENKLAANSAEFTFETFSDQKGSGIKLHDYVSSTGAISTSLNYQSCLGEMALLYSNGTTSCVCPNGKIEDLNSTEKCVPLQKYYYNDVGLTSAYTCTKTVIDSYGTSIISCPAASSICSTPGEVVCCNITYQISGTTSAPTPTVKYRCQ